MAIGIVCKVQHTKSQSTQLMLILQVWRLTGSTEKQMPKMCENIPLLSTVSVCRESRPSDHL